MILQRSLITFLCLPFALAIADDTELFVSVLSAQNGIKPQVLIIFDNSGSMTTEESIQTVQADYIASADYGAGSHASRIYWSNEGGDVPDPDSNQYFLSSKNNCQAAVAPLATYGLYNGNVRRWEPNRKSSKSRWKTLQGNSGTWFECKEDMLNQDPSNPGSPSDLGYPEDGRTGPYISTVNSVFSGDGVTLYSANYVYWKASSGDVTKTRLEIAKESIEQLIRSTPSVDFGLAVFNRNDGDGSSDKNGGRIIDRIQTRDDALTQEIINSVNNLSADTWTPLCETMYEAYRYFGGHGVLYGDDDPTRTPERDLNAENSSVYISPFKTCQERSYIILMTDGEPSRDQAADTAIAALTGNSAIEGSYMPTLTQWMNKYDIDSNADNGDQHITTYTIGFGQSAVDDAGQLLSATAVLGGGEYFPAESAAALQNAFQSTILNILNSSSSLSSPAIANNNFDRTRSLDSVYYSMFLPSNKSIWQGNIKKLTMNSQGILVDRNGVPAINDEGNIKDTASTYWGGVEDGNAVQEGGVAEMLTDVLSRKVLSNIDNAILKEPNATNLKAFYSAADDAALADLLEVDSSDLNDSLNWLKGLDVDDENGNNSVVDYRSDIFADPLHSKPLAITYIENDEQIVRLLVGTNAGFLHMFTDNGDTVTENWAFIPEQLLVSSIKLRDEADATEHHYGMDLSPIAIKTYQSGELQKIIAIVGMRRGGGSYFALDITEPNSPSLLWTIDAATSGFSELAQTWSMPSVGTFSYQEGSEYKTVPGVVFGGGYDTNKDTCLPSESETCDDIAGRAVYIVNALTGAKIWSVEAGVCVTGDNHCLKDSIPSKASLLDSDGDGYIDRVYVGDTGANLWRMDLVGTDVSKWSHIKLADLGGDTLVSDRKFFTAPVIVRTYENYVTVDNDGIYSYKKLPYDGLLLGSGDRAHPASDTKTSNAFYSIHDYHINPLLFGATGYPDKPTPLTATNLFDITNDPVANYNGDQVLSVFANMSALSGWKYQFSDEGEKSLGQGAVLDGTVYFTSFVPNSTVNITCGVGNLGIGWLYAVDLHSGSSRFKNEEGEVIVKRNIGSRVPDSLVIHAGIDEEEKSVVRLLGVGQGDTITVIDEVTQEAEIVHSGTVDTQTDMMPRRIYSFFEER
ncbi:PilC/PilY family type IV pilus protein [Psychromonas sp.]|nr:PilC/PilY family type IV pilus protein [Psychromonas sp.]